MSYYVRRVAPADSDAARRGHHVGWVGPIRSRLQAGREHDAWIEAGWIASVHDSTPEIRAEVRAWESDVAIQRRRSGR
jgi:hypothetical protein